MTVYPTGVATGVPAGLGRKGSPARPPLGRNSCPPHPAMKLWLFVGLATGVPRLDIGCRWEASPMAAGLRGHGFLTGDVPAIRGHGRASLAMVGAGCGGVPVLVTASGLSKSAASTDPRRDTVASELLGEPLLVLASDIAMPPWLVGRWCRRRFRLPFFAPSGSKSTSFWSS